MQRSSETPHQAALKMAKGQLKDRKRQDTNTLGLGAGALGAEATVQILDHHQSPCASCARLVFHPENKKIGCSSGADSLSPAEMARAAETAFLYELSCEAQLPIAATLEAATTENGLLVYNYRGE